MSTEKEIFQWCGTSGIAPHRLERQFDDPAPNEKWFTDVTYLLFGERTLYLSTIMDAFNCETISYVASESQTLP